MAYHKDETGESIHVIHAFEYADETEREAATGLTPADIGKIARQVDTGVFYVLENDSPVTWHAISGDTDGGTF